MPETVGTASETRERTKVDVEVRELSDEEERQRVEQRERLSPGDTS